MEKDFSNVLSSIYILYIIIFFKTKWSIHHPLESYILQDRPKWIQHPVSSGRYENKICCLGHWTAIGLVLWIWIRRLIPKKKIWNTIIWITILVVGSCMNLNFFIYLLPIAIYDMMKLGGVRKPFF